MSILTALWLAVIGFSPLPAQGFVYIYYDETVEAPIYKNASSQILPAPYLLFHISHDSFMYVSPDDPAIIEIRLPPETSLSRTLATGTPNTTSPLPSGGEVVQDLALVGYREEKSSSAKGRQMTAKAIDFAGPHAIQLFRYVAGENVILIRITESTSDWMPNTEYDFYGFTIGLPANVWPATPDSNLGSEGMYTQPSTLFYLDMRDYPAAEAPVVKLNITTYYQYSLTPIYTLFMPAQLALFHISGVLEEQTFVTSTIGGELTDFATADLNGDGWDDIVSIDENANRLYWSFGQPDQRFTGLEWRETVGIIPVTVDVADVSGDRLPDVLIGDDTGNLIIYLWEDLFLEEARSTRVALPSGWLKMPGRPSDSLVKDLNDDGLADYIFTDAAAGQLNILFGDSFTASNSYLTGAMPMALTDGDFNGDSRPDIAVANKDSNSLSVYLNETGGTFTPNLFMGVGRDPVDLAGADFDRDGFHDLAFLLEGDKALSILKASNDGQFTMQLAQNPIFFMHTPASLLAENLDGRSGPDVLLGYRDHHVLSLCTSDDTGKLSLTDTLDTLADVIVDPENNVRLPEDNILSVGGGSGFGGVSSREGAAAVSRSGFNVIHFPRSAEISFSVVNRGAGDCLLNLELFNDSGQYYSSATESIPIHSQFARYFDGLLGPEANQSQRWVRAFLTDPGTYGLWLMNNFDEHVFLDGTQAPDIRQALFEFVFTGVQVEGENFTEIYLMNPRQEQASVTVELYHRFGNLKESTTFWLVGRGREVIDVATTFPGAANGDYIVVRSDPAIIGVEVFGTADSIACLPAMIPGRTMDHYYSAHIAQGNLGAEYDSILTLVNTGEENVKVGLRLLDADGHQIAATFSGYGIAPHGKLERNIADLLFNVDEPFTGHLIITPETPAPLLGHVTYIHRAGGEFYSALPIQPAEQDKFLMGHIANGTLGTVNYYTGMAIVNPRVTPINVGITAYAQSGERLESQNAFVPASGRLIFLLHDLLPNLTSIFGGYIIVENRNPGSGIVVFQLFGDDTGQFMAAVPAIPLQ
ncbi:MAG: VCBS repeat-containing protein [Acidobacteria bacterium]|nr:VCBS repeat-containing protein [Acidobacteriota bacterium]